MSAIQVDQLELNICVNSKQVAASLKVLEDSLLKLKSVTKGGLGLKSVSNQINTLNASLDNLSHAKANKLKNLSDSILSLSRCKGIEISPKIATEVKAIAGATDLLSTDNFNSIYRLTGALKSFGSLEKTKLGTYVSNLRKLPVVLKELDNFNSDAVNSKMKDIVNALSPLSTIGKTTLSSINNELRKLPKTFRELSTLNMAAFKMQIEAITKVLKPLATEMEKVSRGFSAFPAKLKMVANKSNMFSGTARAGSITSFAGIAFAANRVGKIIGSFVSKSNEYIESLNLFTVSLGKYAEEAKEYAGLVSELMGIDPATWLKNQGIFMTLATGFGVASDRAYTMSKNLTQLGYDLSSFFNIRYQDAFQKLQSGIAGELEPLRRLGYDLSNARLQQEAYTLGIQKKVTAMTQAEKAELRYYAIMTQVTSAQQDMSRTLEAPANQIRILKAQLDMCAKSLGNIFLPMLQAVLPYLIAFAKVVRTVADVIASLFNFKLPSFTETFEQSAVGAGGIADGLGEAAKKAKEVKNAMIGIDELNVISPKEDSGAGSGSTGVGGGGIGFELPEYDFIGNAVSNRIEEITNKLKEWLGVAEQITSWNEFFHTRLGQILSTVGAIGAGFLAWKISSNIISGIEKLKAFLSKGMTLPLTIGLAVGSLTLELAGLRDIIVNGINGINLGQTVAGALGLTIAAGLLGNKFAGPIASALATVAGNPAIATAFASKFAATLFSAGIGSIIGGIPAFIAGVRDSLKNGLSLLSVALTEFGAGLTGLGVGIIGAAIGAWGGPIGAAIGGVVGIIVGAITNLGVWLYQNWDEISSWASSKWSAVVSWWDETVVPFVQKIPDWFRDRLEDTRKWFVEKWDAIVSYMQSVPAKISLVIENISTWFKTLPYKIGYALGEVIGRITTWINDTYNLVQERIPQIVQSIQNWFSELPDRIKNAIRGAIDRVTTWAVDMKETFRVKVSDMIEAVRMWFSETPQKIFNEIIKLKEKLVDWADQIKAKASEIIPDVIDNIVGFFKEIPKRLFDLGKDICQGLVDGIKNAWHVVKEGVSDFVGGFVDGVKEGFDINSPSRVLRGIGQYVVEGFNLGIKDMIGSSVNETRYWASKVREAIPADSFAIKASYMVSDTDYLGDNLDRQLQRSYNITSTLNNERTSADRSESYLATACELLEIIAGKDFTIDGRVLNEQINNINKRNGYRLRTT